MSAPARVIAAAEYTAKSGFRIVGNEGTLEDHLYNTRGRSLEYQQQFLQNQPSTSAVALMAMADKAVAVSSCNDVTMEQKMSTEWGTMQQSQYNRDVDMDGVGIGNQIGAAGLEYQQHQSQLQFIDPSTKNIDNGNEIGLTENSTTANAIEQEINLCTSDELFQKLNEFDALQEKYHTSLDLPKESKVSFFIHLNNTGILITSI